MNQNASDLHLHCVVMIHNGKEFAFKYLDETTGLA